MELRNELQDSVECGLDWLIRRQKLDDRTLSPV